jgi:hypothetical protein
MSDQKSPKNEQFDDGFNEDFDFGENQPEMRTIQSGPKRGLNTKILASLITIVIGVILGVGYKFYFPLIGTIQDPISQASSADIKTTTRVQTTPLQTQATLQEKIAPTQIRSTVVQTDPLPAAVPAPSAAPSLTVQTDVHMTEIADAFSAADLPATTSNVATNPNSPSTHSATKTPLRSPSTAAPATGAAAMASPSNAVTTSENQLNGSITKLNDGLTKLNQQVDDIINQIKYLDSYSHTMSENLNKLNDSISAVDQRLSTLTNTTSLLSKDVGSVRTEVGQVKEVLKEDGLGHTSSSSSAQAQGNRGDFGESKINIEEPEYRVHAIIPGRAWLKSAQGQIITVAEGDAIGNYGKILVIDAANSVVLTSSGVAFR